MLLKTGYIHPNFGRLRFQIIVNFLITIKYIKRNCNFIKLRIIGKFTIITLVFNILLWSIKIIVFFPNIAS